MMRGPELPDDDLMQQEETLSDDDNAQVDLLEEAEADREDPLLMAIDDLEGRVVSALDDIKLHPGTKTSTEVGAPNVHEELATLLRPVLEVAAHTGPSIARTYYRGMGNEGVEASVEDVYQRVVSDLVLPVMLEMAQSDTSPAKRAATLAFFRDLWKECRKAGSWLDTTTTGPQAGPYGAGGSHHAASAAAITPALKALAKRRLSKRMAREGEILRYWVKASIACTTPGVFTSEEAEGAVAARGIIAASASLRPSLKHISQRIKDADDRGANQIFAPVMKMVEGVLKKLFLGSSSGEESIRSACIKFMEIVILCCSRKPQDTSGRRRGQTSSEDFSLDDLPAGHPIITREALETIAEYAFTVLRGLNLLGGQVKIDANLISDMMMGRTPKDGSPSAQVVSILKPAALGFLEIESSLPKDDNGEDSLEYELDRSSIEYDFLLDQKSYALTINAMSALALNRPVFFKESAVCICRRAVQPPVEGPGLSKTAVLAIISHLRSCCLTLLRNALSVSTKAADILHAALKNFDMEMQADKALSMAKQATVLKTAGRAARNRANMFYEWEHASETAGRASKRQRETDDALAKMRAVKAARGLGHGIQLPTSMSDCVDLIFANLAHLPAKRPPAGASSKSRKVPISLDFVVDAVLTGGASLQQEEGRWYDRDGGTAWSIDLQADSGFEPSPMLLETMEQGGVDEDQPNSKRHKLFVDQCHAAASDAVGRILASTGQAKTKALATLGNQLASRLAFTLKGVQPPSDRQEAFALAKDSVSKVGSRLESEEAKSVLEKFVDSYPLVASAVALGSSSGPEQGETAAFDLSLSEVVLNEALLQPGDKENEASLWQYDRTLELFVATVVRSSELANEKPSDNDKKKAAVRAALGLQKDFIKLPRLTTSSLLLICAMCDIEDITKKAAEASHKSSQESIAVGAAIHAAKAAAEKRATAALLILRDAAFQRDVPQIRSTAVQCVVGLASGRLPSSAAIQDKSLSLVMNVMFKKNESLANFVADGSIAELERASKLAIESFAAIQKANQEADETAKKNPLAPHSDEEKKILERMRKPAVLCMAICVRRPEMIQALFSLSSVEKADVLSKAVRGNMSKLSRAVAVKHGAAAMALRVASMTGPQETPMLLAFLESLAPASDKKLPEQDIIDTCFKIQELKVDDDGKKDPRYIIPVVSSMKRTQLIGALPEFVAAEDKIFLAALVRMGDRVGRQALIFREEPDEENPTLYGMTLCEQLVFLHKLDFAAAGLPQKKYLGAIKLCLNDEEVYNDNVIMAALDHMSGAFVSGSDKLPLAFMRTCIVVCLKHETLQSWMCHVLLPRLVEGKIYEDARQWEGWMRCAHALDESGDATVSSAEAIKTLPPEQLMQYQTKWAGS